MRGCKHSCLCLTRYVALSLPLLALVGAGAALAVSILCQRHRLVHVKVSGPREVRCGAFLRVAIAAFASVDAV